MRVLAITKIFPNAVVPLDAPHIGQRYASLGARCGMTVLATIPWYPGASLFGRWSYAGRIAGAPRREVIRGLEVLHPRFLFIPKVALPVQWMLYAASLLPAVAARRGSTDVILATWLYPDGVASIWIGRRLGLPVVVEAIGSDVNDVGARVPVRALLRRFLPLAAGAVAVSRPLGDRLVALGAPADRINVIPTGVDRRVFYPADRAAARRRLGRPANERLVLYVGRNERTKGVLDLIAAFRDVARSDPQARLVFVGSGPADPELSDLVHAPDLAGRVDLVGQRPLAAVAEWLAACDVLALPSWNEGTPNVILEALSAGRRVVACSVGGVPDLISSPLLGELVAPRDVPALAAALRRAVARPYDPLEVSRSSNVLGLGEVAARLEACLERARTSRLAARDSISLA